MGKRLVLAAAFGAIAIVFGLALVSCQSGGNGELDSVGVDLASVSTGVAGVGGLEAVGVYYQECTTPPGISKEQAIAAAKSWWPVQFEQATQVEAKYVLYSVDEEMSTGKNSLRPYQNVPAWVVTLRGLSMMGHGPGPGGLVNTELNVVVDAQTGECMEAFSYR